MTPEIVVSVALEGTPAAFLVAESREDEIRLRTWLACPAARRRLLDSLEATLDRLADAERRTA